MWGVLIMFGPMIVMGLLITSLFGNLIDRERVRLVMATYSPKNAAHHIFLRFCWVGGKLYTPYGNQIALDAGLNGRNWKAIAATFSVATSWIAYLKAFWVS